MKAGGPVESGIQACHNKYLAVNLPKNLGILEVLKGFTGVSRGFLRRFLRCFPLLIRYTTLLHRELDREWMAKIVGGGVRTCRHLADAYW